MQLKKSRGKFLLSLSIVIAVLLGLFFFLTSKTASAVISSSDMQTVNSSSASPLVNKPVAPAGQGEYLISFSKQTNKSSDAEIKAQRDAFEMECKKQGIHYEVVKDFLPFINVLYVKMSAQDMEKMKKIPDILIEVNGPVHTYQK